MLVFGSFTEDETKSLFQKPSSGHAEKPVEKKELQFGSLNFATGITFGNFKAELSGQLGRANGKAGFHPTNSLKKDKDTEFVTKPDDFPAVLGSPKENGSIDNAAYSPKHNNGVKDLKIEIVSLSSSHLPQKEDGPASQSQSLNFHVLDNGGIKDWDQDGISDNSPVHDGKKEDIQKATDGPVTTVRNLLPRGLINSGNLCFLNATLQALLSCSPFLHLLQELRIRDIPKVCYLNVLTYGCCLCFRQ